MRPAATRPRVSSTFYVAFELGNAEWKRAMTSALEQAPRISAMPARDLQILAVELTRAKQHFGLPATAAVVTCYEAGRDGFWLHRCRRAGGCLQTRFSPRDCACGRLRAWRAARGS